jgi:hypothetical protein
LNESKKEYHKTLKKSLKEKEIMYIKEIKFEKILKRKRKVKENKSYKRLYKKMFKLLFLILIFIRFINNSTTILKKIKEKKIHVFLFYLKVNQNKQKK